MYNSEDSCRQWEIDSKIRTTRSLWLKQWEVEVYVWEREVRHRGWLTGTQRLKLSDMIVFLLFLPLGVSVQDAQEKPMTINEKCKSSRWWCCLFWVLTHALLSFSSASHVFAHSFYLVFSFAGHWGRSCVLLCVCGFKADASVCCLPLSIPASSLTPSFLSSIHLSIHQPAIRPFVHHPLFSVLCEAACWCCVSFLLSSCKCECYKLALWKSVPLEELHRNVTIPHAFTWLNIYTHICI